MNDRLDIFSTFDILGIFNNFQAPSSFRANFYSNPIRNVNSILF